MTDDIVLRRDGKREREGKPPSPFLYIGLPEDPVGAGDNEKPPVLPGELFSREGTTAAGPYQISLRL